MTQISDTQALILNAAAQRQDRIAMPLPATLRGGAAAKVIGAMINKGLLEEVEADPRKGDAMWRETGDGHGLTLVATDAGLQAIGIELEPEATEPEATEPEETEPAPRFYTAPADGAADEATPARAAKRATAPRGGSKQEALLEMLRRPGGATVAEVSEKMGWQAHTVRAAISAGLVKKFGVQIQTEKVEGRGRVYRVA